MSDIPPPGEKQLEEEAVSPPNPPVTEMEMDTSPVPPASSSSNSSHHPPADSLEAKIEAAKAFKEEGNELFKQQQFKKANAKYFRALAYTKGLPGRPAPSGSDPMAKMAVSQSSALAITPELAQQLDELDSTVKNNLAASFLKLDEPTKALQYATEALELCPASWKAALRKGEALLLLRSHEKAHQALDLALSLAPDEAAKASVTKAKAKGKGIEAKEKEKQKKAFANIFEKERAELEKKRGSLIDTLIRYRDATARTRWEVRKEVEALFKTDIPQKGKGLAFVIAGKDATIPETGRVFTPACRTYRAAMKYHREKGTAEENCLYQITYEGKVIEIPYDDPAGQAKRGEDEILIHSDAITGSDLMEELY